MPFACLISNRWLFVKRGNPGFKDEAVTEKARLGISEIWVNVQNWVFFFAG